jgi:hypothetical protein
MTEPLSTGVDPHRLTEFIYGAVTAMVAVAGIDSVDGFTWNEAAATVIAGAVAIWIAHAYAGMMGHRVSSGSRLGPRALANALRSTWPVVAAGIIIALPLAGAGLGLYGIPSALIACHGVGIAILACVGWSAGRASQASWARKSFLIALSCGLGLLVVALERLVHH